MVVYIHKLFKLWCVLSFNSILFDDSGALVQLQMDAFYPICTIHHNYVIAIAECIFHFIIDLHRTSTNYITAFELPVMKCGRKAVINNILFKSMYKLSILQSLGNAISNLIESIYCAQTY